VGLGGSLLPKEALRAGDWGAIEARARQVASLVAQWRSARTR
jgi:2-keto-3-deoxy-6-phosphogluconate aldolase